MVIMVDKHVNKVLCVLMTAELCSSLKWPDAEREHRDYNIMLRLFGVVSIKRECCTC